MTTKTNILIVDDDVNVRKTLTDTLRAKGYAPIAAAAGKAALDRIEEETPSVALVDLDLEDMPGLELMMEIKQRSPDTECIVITEHASQASAVEAVNLGAYGYVQKPYSVDQLLVTIRRAVEKRGAVEALHQSEKRYRSIVEYSHVGIFIVDEAYRFVYVNDELCRILGRSRDEIADQDFRRFLDDESRGLVADRYVRRQRGEEVPPRYEFNVVRQDGEKRRVGISSTVIRDSAGQAETVAQILDITERVQAEEERERLLVAEREQRLLAETLREVTLALSSQLSHETVLDEILHQAQRLVPHTTANIALLEGDTLSIVRWWGYRQFGTDEFMTGLTQPLSKFLLDAEAVRSHTPLVVADTRQEPRWVVLDETDWIRSYLTVPICRGEQVLGLLRLDGESPAAFSTQDAQRLQPLANAATVALENARLYEQARHDAENKTMLLREVNHRILNNLSAIAGLLDAEEQHASAEEKAIYRSMSQKLITRLSGLATVHRLLSTSEWQPLELSDLAGQVIHSSLQILPPGKQVVVGVSPSPFRVTSDQAHNLALVINELATNTVKHTLAGRDMAHIAIRIVREGDTIQFEFRDDGPGYPEEVLHLKHHRVGLDLVQNLVRRSLRGELSLRNDGGAVTVIRFPAMVYGRVPMSRARNVRVLIAEDDYLVSTSIKRMLEGIGYTVVGQAADGRQAVEMAQATRPDVILMDIEMPEMDSMEASRIIQERYPTAVVIVTAHQTPELVRQASAAGAGAYLVKPITARELQNAITISLARFEDMMELRNLNEALQAEIAERKRAESQRDATLEALRKSEARLRQVIEGNVDAIAVVDWRGIVRFVNPATKALFGRQGNELVGTPFGLPLTQEEGTEIDIARQGGEAVVAEMRVVEIDWEGEAAYLASLRDITERVRARAEIARLAAVIEQATTAVMITDPDGRIVYVNPFFEKLTGYAKAEALGQKPSILKSGHHDEAFYQELWETIPAGRTWTGMFVNKRKDGSLFHEEATLFPIKNADGEIINYAAVKRDVTREVELEEKFRQAQKMEALGRLAGGIAHDFNNLLTVIHLSTRLVERQLRREDPLWEHAQRIQDAAQRATKLTRQLLSFSRREVVEPRVLNLNELVGDMGQMLKRVIGEDIELVTDLAQDLWPVHVGPSQVDQVIMNLVVNARDAMSKGGTLTIETANAILDEAYAARHIEVQPGQYVMLAIHDTGLGMDGEVQAHLFEPFFTTKERGKGTGLGLATVFGIVKQNGGGISVHSEVGQGTTFKIYLPCAERSEAQARPTPLPSAPKSRQRTETILLVEDEAIVREPVAHLLRTRGYQVLTARNGEEALQISQDHEGPIDLLLTDVVMPQMNGGELAERLRPQRPRTRVMFMSGYADEKIAHHGVLEEGVAFLSKPFTLESLTQKVRAVLDGEV